MDTDIVYLVSGWIVAFAISCGWGYTEYCRTKKIDSKAMASEAIKWLEVAAKDERVRKRIDVFWNTDIKPAFEKFIMKVFGNTLDWENIMKRFEAWGNAPWDDEKKDDTDE